MRAGPPLLLALLASSLAAGCGLPTGTVVVEQVNVDGVDGDQVWRDNLEVEIHVYALDAADAARHVACASEDTGLNVDRPALTTHVQAYFRPAGYEAEDQPLLLQELPERFFLVVTEQDGFGCPGEQTAVRFPRDGRDRDAPSARDDLIGISAPMVRADLARRTQLVFPGVPNLTLSPLGADARGRAAGR